MYLSDPKHRDIAYECVHGGHGVNIFRETQHTDRSDARGYRYDSNGQMTKWVETRPVTHKPRKAGQEIAEKLPTTETFYDNGGRKRKRRKKHGFLPIICTPTGRQPILHMITSRISLQYSATIANQFHSWCRSGALTLVGDKRVERANRTNWKELSLAWLSLVVEPKKPR